MPFERLKLIEFKLSEFELPEFESFEFSELELLSFGRPFSLELSPLLGVLVGCGFMEVGVCSPIVEVEVEVVV